MMSDIHVRYLLIGGGVASGAAVRGIRQVDQSGSLMLVGQEINRPYYRRLLGTNYLLGKIEHKDLFMQPDAWYAEQHIDLRTGRTGANLDVNRQVVTLDNGQEISFDRLLIATGATPQRLRVPGSDLPNIYYLRSLEEADRLHHAVSQALHEGRKHPHGRGRAVVVGGGLLAVELAATLHQAGLGIDLVCLEKFIWHSFAGESISAAVSRFLLAKGMNIHADATPLRLEGDGRVQRVVLSDGQTIDTDLVVASIGATPNKQLLRGTPIRSETAILTDSQCRTNVPEIFAAGECAAIFDPLFGKHRLLKHQSSAVETGSLAGRNMAGAGEEYSQVNQFGSEMLGLSAVAWGEARFVHHRIVHGSPSAEEAKPVELGVSADHTIVQATAIGRGIDERTLPELIRRRVNVAGREEAIKDPAFELGSLI